MESTLIDEEMKGVPQEEKKGGPGEEKEGPGEVKTKPEEKFIHRLDLLEMVGSGSFGIVHLARLYTDTNVRDVAVKIQKKVVWYGNTLKQEF